MQGKFLAEGGDAIMVSDTSVRSNTEIVRAPPQRILGPRHHCDVAALARQFFRDGSSDAEACSRDESPLAFDEEIQVNSP